MQAETGCFPGLFSKFAKWPRDLAKAKALLREAGLKPVRVELLPKDMQQAGRAGLAGWVRTTWLPYTQRVPEPLREQFILELVDSYLDRHPLDIHGFAHVPMVRLEVEAAV